MMIAAFMSEAIEIIKAVSSTHRIGRRHAGASKSAIGAEAAAIGSNAAACSQKMIMMLTERQLTMPCNNSDGKLEPKNGL